MIVELVGGRNPAGSWVRRALESGRSVVTANKQLIAHEGPALAQLASAQRQQLRFEAAVAGGIPVIGALREGIAGDRVDRITGILNGTCNFILTSMEHEGAAFADALARAQELGYAEADPTDDVQGYDARAKLAILCAVGFRVPVAPEAIACRPITLVDAIDFRYAGELGCTIRQISQAAIDDEAADRIVASVRPSVVPKNSPLARVDGSQNIIVARGQYGGDTVYSGSGAGGGPTSVAIVSDLVALSHAIAASRDPTSRAQRRGPRRLGVRDRALPAVHRARSAPASWRASRKSLAAARHQHRRRAAAARRHQGRAAVRGHHRAVRAGDAGRARWPKIGALDFHVCPPVDLPLMSDGSPR